MMIISDEQSDQPATDTNKSRDREPPRTQASQIRSKIKLNQSAVSNKQLEAATQAMKTQLVAIRSQQAATSQSDYKTKAIAHRLQLLASKQGQVLREVMQLQSRNEKQDTQSAVPNTHELLQNSMSVQIGRAHV